MVSRLLLSLEEASLTYGGKPLFDGVSLYVSEGDKICLVGRNGAGKTTLMRLLTGELELDEGTRFCVPGLRIGYLAQKVDFKPEETVREHVLGGIQHQDGWQDKEHLADMALSALGVEGGLPMGTLSGGQLRRAGLASALMAEPDILLLDEPTNHLDLQAIGWLEQWVASYRGALICVSHDRAFLKAISQKTFWIDRGTVRTSPFGYAKFDEWAEQMLEQEARELQNMQKKLEAEVDWTQGGVTGRRKRNVRRLGELHRLREKLRADKASYNQTMRTIELDPIAPVLASKIICEFTHVSKSFVQDDQETVILNDFNLRVMRGDRIGILGNNGSGKSTFLKLLTGEMAPDKGSVKRGKTVEISYFDQNRTTLNPQKTLWQTLCPDGGEYVTLGQGADARTRHVCGYLKDFLFDPKLARDKVSTLSGGQQNRLLLAKMLANPGNVLILDEPTNDLDMDTLDMLQEILSDYQGTLLIVSHDRDFLDRTVAKVLAFEGDGKVEGVIGGYSDYLAFKQGKPVTQQEKPVVQTEAPVRAASRSSVIMSYKLKHEFETLPAKMDALGKELESLKTKLADGEFYQRDPKGFDTATRRYAEAQAELDRAEIRWLELDEIASATN
ncbi:ATP-binding cassette domain-containing protein [bacterium]|nr:ATP-binding cassette domain-containing protein [bacterium]